MPSLSPLPPGQVLGRNRAAHLLRRITFGANPAETDRFSDLSVNDAVMHLLAPHPLSSPPLDLRTGQPWANPGPDDSNSEERDLLKMVLSWWLAEMMQSDTHIFHKITWFWHTHFTTMRSRVQRGTALYYQIRLFQYHALGNARALSTKICRDNAMLLHLDGRLNRKDSPNENFAREFFELYSIGKGAQVGPDDYTNYTEHDIREAARVLSGYTTDFEYSNIDPESGVAMGSLRGGGDLASMHDEGIKTFSERFDHMQIAPGELIDGVATKSAAIQELHDFVHMVFDREATAQNLCRKLYRFFVYPEITSDVEDDIIAPLAAMLIDNDYEVRPVLDALFRSRHFYDEDTTMVAVEKRGALIKSPLEIVVGSMRFFDISVCDPGVDLHLHYETYHHLYNKILSEQGLDLYEPPEVAGYKPYHQGPMYHRNWITSNDLAKRYQWSQTLLLGIKNSNNVHYFKLNILEHITRVAIDRNDPRAIVSYHTSRMLPRTITGDRFDYFLSALLVDVQEEDWVQNVIEAEDFIIIFHLESLINALMQSPEYQLF